MKSIKSLFSTPKRAIRSCACALGLIAMLGTGTVYAASGIAESASIGAENAKKFAFADAGVDPVSAESVRAKFDFEMGTFVYEVEFTSGGIEYEYLIKASDGSVIQREMEALKTGAGTALTQIGLDAAKEKALADAGLTADAVTFTKAKLDYDGGVPVYDVEFYTSTHEYEYELDAKTGSIRERSKEAIEVSVTNSGNGQTGSSYIGADKAKATALSHAGLSASEVSFTKVKLETDDGLAVYEIEFCKGRMEYEYTINAINGNIVDFETDWDD